MRVAWGAAVIAVVAVIVWVVLVLVPPSQGDLVRLVQKGDPTIDAHRAGCIVQTMRKSLTASRTEQILKGSGRRIKPSEENVVVTAAAKCGGAPDVDLRGHGRAGS